MADISHRHETCRLCETGRLLPVLKLKPTPIADDYRPADRRGDMQPLIPLEIGLCMDCGHAQLLDFVNPDILYKQYLYKTTTSLGLSEHFSDYAKQLVDLTGHDDSGLFIDIGSNDGTLLRELKSRSRRVLGVDPAVDVAKKAADSGIETLPVFFSTEVAVNIKKNYGPATVVTANNVMANVDALTDMISGVKKLLGPKGVFVFETGYLLDLMQNYVFDNIYHEHLYYFSTRPLSRFFYRHGMELFHVERVPTKGGSIRGFVRLQNGTGEISSSVRELISIEENAGLFDPETYRVFAMRLDAVKDEIHELLAGIKSKQASVCGYGASHSVTTMVHHFELGGGLKFLVDDNPLKQGLVSPGYHLPVHSSAAIYELNPDFVFILPWRFAGPIMNKHQPYLKRGGRFIVPLPQFEVIPSIK